MFNNDVKFTSNHPHLGYEYKYIKEAKICILALNQ